MISLIVAMDRNGLIGSHGKLPWSIKSEMKHFKEITTGNICIFGRKTWESLPNPPLQNRVNINISSKNGTIRLRDHHLIDFAIESTSIWGAIKTSYERYPGKEIFICGGRSLYEQTLPFVDRIYLSYIYGNYEGDTFFPCKPLDLMYEKDFSITQEKSMHVFDDSQSWDFYLLERHIRTF